MGQNRPWLFSVAVYLCWLKRRSVFSKTTQMEMTVVVVFPIVVGLDLATLLLGSKHDNYSHILLPDNLPKVLKLRQPYYRKTIWENLR